MSNSGSDDQDSILMANSNFYPNLNGNSSFSANPSNMLNHPMHLNQINLLNDQSTTSSSYTSLNNKLSSPTEKTRYFDLNSSQSSICFNPNMIPNSNLIDLRSQPNTLQNVTTA